jgi:hypothetical protein
MINLDYKYVGLQIILIPPIANPIEMGHDQCKIIIVNGINSLDPILYYNLHCTSSYHIDMDDSEA